MSIPIPHQFDLSVADAVALQRTLAPQVVESALPDPTRVRLIAGVDVSSDFHGSLLTAGIVVWDRSTDEVIETVSVQQEGRFPYVPGLLSFREIPSILNAHAKLTCKPDAFFVDGHGRAHPRRLGIASHLGLLIDRPTVGVAKHKLVGAVAELGVAASSTAAVVDRGERIGTALRTRVNADPVFVSVGHRISLAQAETLVLESVRGYRLPEPTRLAHLYVNAVRRGEEWRRQELETVPSGRVTRRT